MSTSKPNSPLDILMSNSDMSDSANETVLQPAEPPDKPLVVVEDPDELRTSEEEILEIAQQFTSDPVDHKEGDRAVIVGVASPVTSIPDSSMPRSILKGSLRANVVANREEEKDSCMNPEAFPNFPKPLSCLFTHVFQSGPLRMEDFKLPPAIPEEIRTVAFLELFEVKGEIRDSLYKCLIMMGLELFSQLPDEKRVVTRNTVQGCRVYGRQKYMECKATAMHYRASHSTIEASSLLHGIPNQCYRCTNRDIAPLMCLMYCMEELGVLRTKNGVAFTVEGFLLYLVYLVFKREGLFLNTDSVSPFLISMNSKNLIR